MTPEQKQRAQAAITKWWATDSNKAVLSTGYEMAGVLQEMVDAPESEPVARVTGYYAGYLSIATVDGSVLPAGTALYAAPPHQSEHHLEMVNTPAPSVPDGWKLVPVEPTPEMMRSGMNVPFNKAARHNAVYRAMLAAAPTPAEAPTN